MTHLLHIALEAAIKAGDEIMKIYTTDFNIELKGDYSPLTIADKNANTIICSYLEKLDTPIISEENKQTDFDIRKKWDSCWIVDPLDGTKEFIKRNGEFTVNIAYVTHGKPILGVIYVPVTKALYFTNPDATSAFKVIVNKEKTLDELLTEAKKIGPDVSKPSQIKIVGSRSHLNEATKAYIEKIKREHSVEIVSKGSSLKFCLVAEGKAHLYPRYAPTMEWDTAAGHAICQAVGVQVIDTTTKAPLQYNKENLLNNNFLVSV